MAELPRSPLPPFSVHRAAALHHDGDGPADAGVLFSGPAGTGSGRGCPAALTGHDGVFRGHAAVPAGSGLAAGMGTHLPAPGRGAAAHGGLWSDGGCSHRATAAIGRAHVRTPVTW